MRKQRYIMHDDQINIYKYFFGFMPLLRKQQQLKVFHWKSSIQHNTSMRWAAINDDTNNVTDSHTGWMFVRESIFPGKLGYINSTRNVYHNAVPTLFDTLSIKITIGSMYPEESMSEQFFLLHHPLWRLIASSRGRQVDIKIQYTYLPSKKKVNITKKEVLKNCSEFPNISSKIVSSIDSTSLCKKSLDRSF